MYIRWIYTVYICRALYRFRGGLWIYLGPPHYNMSAKTFQCTNNNIASMRWVGDGRSLTAILLHTLSDPRPAHRQCQNINWTHAVFSLERLYKPGNGGHMCCELLQNVAGSYNFPWGPVCILPRWLYMWGYIAQGVTLAKIVFFQVWIKWAIVGCFLWLHCDHWGDFSSLTIPVKPIQKIWGLVFIVLKVSHHFLPWHWGHLSNKDIQYIVYVYLLQIVSI